MLYTRRRMTLRRRMMLKKKDDAKNKTVKEEEPTPNAGFTNFCTQPKPKAGAAVRNKGGSNYEQKLLRPTYHGVEDSFWGRIKSIPYLDLAKTLKSIEANRGQLRT